LPKVLRIINRFNIGGITYNVSYLSKYLEPEFETYLVGGPEEEGEDSSLYIPQGLGLKPKVIQQFQREINIKSDYAAYKEIKKIIQEFKPDIIHTHASKAGAIGRLAAIHCNVPVIVHTFHGHVFHSYFGKLKTNFYKFIEKYLAKKSTAIIAISNKQKEELTTEFNITTKEKTHVIPLGFDLKKFTENKNENRKEFREKYQIKEDEIAIGIIGRFAPIKNHKLFIEAIAYLKTNGINKIKAFIIGDGDSKNEILKQCEINNLTFSFNPLEKCDILFTSWITNIEWALHGLDIVTLTSLNEGTPVSIIEAQAAGKFVVATEVGGIRDILHPDCGFLSNIYDKNGFFNNLKKACLEHTILTEKAKNGEEWALKNFSYTRLVNDMRALYLKLLKSA
jgi:glycosyltransferase involved in cell wall biosynthesis